MTKEQQQQEELAVLVGLENIVGYCMEEYRGLSRFRFKVLPAPFHNYIQPVALLYRLYILVYIFAAGGLKS